MPASTDSRFLACADAIISAARDCSERGWTPATSSNFSMRVDENRVAVTASGKDKGRLGREDILICDLHGTAHDISRKPSAETALHLQIYRHFSQARAVLHTHSRTQSVASRHFAAAGRIRLEGWELLKAIGDLRTHATTLDIPVFANSQDMHEIATAVEAWLVEHPVLHAYLIAGHGIYTWGASMEVARRHLEALEFLLACELDLERMKA